MTKQLSATIGTRIEPDSAALQKASQLERQIADNDGVEGQTLARQLSVCPWCGASGWTWIDTDSSSPIQCWQCDKYFQSR